MGRALALAEIDPAPEADHPSKELLRFGAVAEGQRLDAADVQAQGVAAADVAQSFLGESVDDERQDNDEDHDDDGTTDRRAEQRPDDSLEEGGELVDGSKHGVEQGEQDQQRQDPHRTPQPRATLEDLAEGSQGIESREEAHASPSSP